MRSGILALLALIISSLSIAAELPDAPPFGVHDPGNLLGEGAKSVLESMLVEHQRLTHEQIVVAILNEGGPEGFPSRVQALHRHWKLGQLGHGALLAVSMPNKEVAFEADHGFTALLGQDRIREVIQTTARPLVRRSDLGASLVTLTAELLRALESPLAATGELARILDENRLPTDQEPESSGLGMLLMLLLGAALAGATLVLVSQPDAHYTGEGWSKLRPGELWIKSHQRRRSPLAATGGTGGRW